MSSKCTNCENAVWPIDGAFNRILLTTINNYGLSSNLPASSIHNTIYRSRHWIERRRCSRISQNHYCAALALSVNSIQFDWVETVDDAKAHAENKLRHCCVRCASYTRSHTGLNASGNCAIAFFVNRLGTNGNDDFVAKSNTVAGTASPSCHNVMLNSAFTIPI